MEREVVDLLLVLCEYAQSVSSKEFAQNLPLLNFLSIEGDTPRSISRVHRVLSSIHDGRDFVTVKTQDRLFPEAYQRVVDYLRDYLGEGITRTFSPFPLDNCFDSSGTVFRTESEKSVFNLGNDDIDCPNLTGVAKADSSWIRDKSELDTSNLGRIEGVVSNQDKCMLVPYGYLRFGSKDLTASMGQFTRISEPTGKVLVVSYLTRGSDELWIPLGHGSSHSVPHADFSKNCIIENKASSGRFDKIKTSLYTVFNRVDFRHPTIPRDKSLSILDGTGLYNLATLAFDWNLIARRFGLRRFDLFDPRIKGSYIEKATPRFREAISEFLGSTEDGVDTAITCIVESMRSRIEKSQVEYYAETGIWVGIPNLGLDLPLTRSLAAHNDYILPSQFGRTGLPKLRVSAKVGDRFFHSSLVVERNSLFVPRHDDGTWVIGFRENFPSSEHRSFDPLGPFGELSYRLDSEFLDAMVNEVYQEVMERVGSSPDLLQTKEVKRFRKEYDLYLDSHGLMEKWRKSPYLVRTRIQREYLSRLFSTPKLGLSSNWIGLSIGRCNFWNPPRTILRALDLSGSSLVIGDDLWKLSLDHPSYWDVVLPSRNPLKTSIEITSSPPEEVVKRRRVSGAKLPRIDTRFESLGKDTGLRATSVSSGQLDPLGHGSHVNVEFSSFDDLWGQVGGFREYINDTPIVLPYDTQSSVPGPRNGIVTMNSPLVLRVVTFRRGGREYRFIPGNSRLDKYGSTSSEVYDEIILAKSQLGQHLSWGQTNQVTMDTLQTLREFSEYLGDSPIRQLKERSDELFHYQNLYDTEDYSKIIATMDDGSVALLLYCHLKEFLSGSSSLISLTIGDEYNGLESIFFPLGGDTISDLYICHRYPRKFESGNRFLDMVENTLGNAALQIDRYIKWATLGVRDIYDNFHAWERVTFRRKAIPRDHLMSFALSLRAPNLARHPVDGSYMSSDMSIRYTRALGAKSLIDGFTLTQILDSDRVDTGVESIDLRESDHRLLTDAYARFSVLTSLKESLLEDHANRLELLSEMDTKADFVDRIRERCNGKFDI